MGVTIITIDDGSGANIEVKHRLSKQAPSDPKQNAIAPNAESNSTTLDHAPNTKGVTPSGRELSLPEVDIGRVIRVKGGIATYRGQKQVALERIGRSTFCLLQHLPCLHILSISKSNAKFLAYAS